MWIQTPRLLWQPMVERAGRGLGRGGTELTHRDPSTSCPVPPLPPSPKGHSLWSWPIHGGRGSRRPAESRGLASGPAACPGRQSQGFLDAAPQPGPPACSLGRAARARGGAFRLFCPFVGGEFCIPVSILPLNIVTIIYSFFCVCAKEPRLWACLLTGRPSACALAGTPT